MNMEDKEKINQQENIENNIENETNKQEEFSNEAENTLPSEPNYEELIAEQKDKFLRLFAEFDNYKKRVAKERIELFSTAGKEVLIEFIPILDDLERAIKSNENSEDLSAVKEGMKLIYDKMYKSFEKKGVTKIISKGEAFDPDKHEAITEIPAISDEMKGKVMDEVECGYMLGDKIIRFSKVVVGK